MMDKKAKIKTTKNGPYIVTGNVPLKKEKIVVDTEGFPRSWEEVKKYDAKDQYALCRCGRTKNPPFCDGSHNVSGFDGKETAGNALFGDRAEEIVGPDLILKDAPHLCVHARFCDRAGSIWNLTEKSENEEFKNIAIEEAGNCPSGRLVTYDKKAKKAIEPNLEKSISITEDEEGFAGPIWVKGGISIQSSDGNEHEIRNRVTLCRCGQSKNKPFCDGMHYKNVKDK